VCGRCVLCGSLVAVLVVRSGVGAVSSVRSSGGVCSGSSRLRLGVNDKTALQVVGMVEPKPYCLFNYGL